MQNQSNKQKSLGATEQYILDAEKAKDTLFNFINESNLLGTYRFISASLATALTSHYYEEEATRQELVTDYFGLAGILDKCLEFRRAEEHAQYAKGGSNPN